MILTLQIPVQLSRMLRRFRLDKAKYQAMNQERYFILLLNVTSINQPIQNLRALTQHFYQNKYLAHTT